MSRSKSISISLFIVLVLSGTILNADPIYTYNKSYNEYVTYDSDTNVTTIEFNFEAGGGDCAEMHEQFDLVESGEITMDYTVFYETIGPPLPAPYMHNFGGSVMIYKYGGPYFYPLDPVFLEDTNISESATLSLEPGTYGHWNVLCIYGPSNAVFSYQFRTATTTPLPPDISVTPLAWDFGNVAWMGVPRSTLINIANTGGQDLNVGDVSLVDPLVDYTVGTLPSNTVAPDTSVDLEVNFAPTYLGYQEGTLQINSDDPDEPEVYVALSGVGVLEEDTDELVEDIKDFIDDEVAADTLIPDKKNSAKNIKDMLTTYGDLLGDGLVEDACTQLGDIYKKIDGKGSPPDKLDGDSLGTLQDVILTMLTQECGGLDIGGECYTDGQCLSDECDVPVNKNHGVCVEPIIILPPGAVCEPGVDVCVDGYVCVDSAELPYPPYIYKCQPD